MVVPESLLKRIGRKIRVSVSLYPWVVYSQDCHIAEGIDNSSEFLAFLELKREIGKEACYKIG
jgi:hypothetical protein